MTWRWTVVVVVLAAWMQVGPLYKQVFGRPEPPFTKAWRMYSTRGDDVCAVSWYTREGDDQRPVDRIGVLYGGLEKASRPSRLPHKVARIQAEARALCARVGAADVRVDAWCGVPEKRGEWKQVITTDQPLCRP